MSELTLEQKQEKEVGEFFEALGIISAVAGKIYADKEVNALDIPHAMTLAANAGKIVAGFDDLSLVWDAIASMGVDKGISTMRDFYNVGLKYEAARKA